MTSSRYFDIGTTQGIAVIENLIEHVASVCKEDPLAFRQKNFKGEAFPDLKKIIDQVLVSSDYDQRSKHVTASPPLSLASKLNAIL